MREYVKTVSLGLVLMGLMMFFYLPTGKGKGQPDLGEQPAAVPAFQPANVDCLKLPIEGRQSCTKSADCPTGQACVDGTCVMAACSPYHGELAWGLTTDTLILSTR